MADMDIHNETQDMCDGSLNLLYKVLIEDFAKVANTFPIKISPIYATMLVHESIVDTWCTLKYSY